MSFGMAWHGKFEVLWRFQLSRLQGAIGYKLVISLFSKQKLGIHTALDRCFEAPHPSPGLQMPSARSSHEDLMSQ